MAIKGSGKLKMSEIDAEFDQGAKPWKLSKMGVDIGVASGNKIRMKDFYGKSDFIDTQVFRAGYGTVKTGSLGATERGYERSPNKGYFHTGQTGTFKGKNIEEILATEIGNLPAGSEQVWLNLRVKGNHSQTAFSIMGLQKNSRLPTDFTYKFSTSTENTGAYQHLSSHYYSSDTDTTTWEWRNTNEVVSSGPAGKSGDGKRRYFGVEIIEANQWSGEDYYVTWK